MIRRGGKRKPLYSPEQPIFEFAWVSLAEDITRRGWTVQDLQGKRAWARNLGMEVEALREGLRTQKADMLSKVQTFFPELERPLPPRGGRAHHCPKCGHRWIGACQAEADGEAGSQSTGEA